MMTQPAAATGAASNASATAGADSTGTSTSGSTGGNVFSQTLQALSAGAGNAAAPLTAVDASAAEPGTNPVTTNAADSEGALIDAVMLPNARLQASASPFANAGGSGSSAVRMRTDSAQQASTTGAALPAIAKDLLRLLFAKPSELLTTEGAAHNGSPVAGDEHDSKAADQADASTGVLSTGVVDPSGAASTLLLQTPIQAPLTAALKWQEPHAATTMREAAPVPLSATVSVAVSSTVTSLTDPHQAVTAALTRPDSASSAASLMALQGISADAPRPLRLVPDADAPLDTSGMAATLRATDAANAAPVEHTVAVPVHDRHWPTAMAAQVLILSGDKVRAATLRLTPEHLGPLEVRIDMQDSSVNVNFTAAHAETRAALEQAMPQLRSVLAGAGLTLGQATVQQQARHGSQNPNTMLRGAGSVDEVNEVPVTVWRALGLIDEYA